MFRRRSKLARQDQELGLVFSWRVPSSRRGPLVVAILLVGLLSAGLAALVRIRIGSGQTRERQRASLILISEDAGGNWLDAWAVEAGPYPFRWNPAADPEYSAQRGRALRDASRVGFSYRPEPLPLELRIDPPVASDSGRIAYFPALPAVPTREASVEPRQTTLRARVIRSKEGPLLQIPGLPLEAKNAVASSGRRFLIGYQADGQVREVTPLNPDETPADLVSWLGRARVLDHGKKGGWLVVESTIEP